MIPSRVKTPRISDTLNPLGEIFFLSSNTYLRFRVLPLFETLGRRGRGTTLKWGAVVGRPYEGKVSLKGV